MTSRWYVPRTSFPGRLSAFTPDGFPRALQIQ
jgi:hypothetical protein